MSELRVCPSHPDLADDLATLQRLCFPTLGVAELITAAQFRHHLTVFPQGQLVVLDSTDRPVASSSSCLHRSDFVHSQHTYMEASGQNWLSTHTPDGDWLYGIDIGVHPDHRGKGLSRLLYSARKALARTLGKKGLVVAGMLKGFSKYRAHMTAEDYLHNVEIGAIFDPTVSVQLRQGLSVHGLLRHHIDDPTIDGMAARLIWYSDEASTI